MQTCKITPNSLRTIDEYKYNINPNFDLKAITPLVMINDNESLINEGNDVANIFPIEAFPVFFKKIITECNTASNYPCDYTGASLLAAISAATICFCSGLMMVADHSRLESMSLWNFIFSRYEM